MAVMKTWHRTQFAVRHEEQEITRKLLANIDCPHRTMLTQFVIVHHFVCWVNRRRRIDIAVRRDRRPRLAGVLAVVYKRT
jgi:hypothetical protein